jgi:hypothetical protein
MDTSKFKEAHEYNQAAEVLLDIAVTLLHKSVLRLEKTGLLSKEAKRCLTQ